MTIPQIPTRRSQTFQPTVTPSSKDPTTISYTANGWETLSPPNLDLLAEKREKARRVDEEEQVETVLPIVQG